MWTFIVTLLAVVVTILLLFAIVMPTVRKRRHKLAHERLTKEYIYREKPHADQVAESPNKLKDNKVTKG